MTKIMRGLTLSVLFFCFVFILNGQEQSEKDQKLYQKFYLEVNPIGASTVFELIFPARKLVVIPKTVEVGFHFTDRLNFNVGYEADRFRRITTPILPLFSKEQETFQQGYILYMGFEYFLIKHKAVSWNIGTKVFYGDYTSSTLYTNPDLAQTFFIEEEANKIGFGVDMVLLFPLSKHVALSMNPIYARVYRTDGERSTFDEDIFLNERVFNLDFRAELFTQVGLRFNL